MLSLTLILALMFLTLSPTLIMGTYKVGRSKRKTSASNAFCDKLFYAYASRHDT